MSASHTPGTWRASAVAGGWDGVVDSRGTVICTLSLNEPANAHVLAAAPEFLEIGREFVAFAKAGNSFIYPSGALYRLHRIIAKAEGTASPVASEVPAERDRLKEINQELLEALKAVVKAWTYEASQGDGIMEDHSIALDTARAAIAKAEGKEGN